MTGELAGRVAIVTGGTRGIGAAVTETLARDGATVVAVYSTDHAAAAALNDRLRADDLLVSARAGDIGEGSFCRKLVESVVAIHGRLDHLVNNAGLLVENSPRRMTEAEWDAALRINLSAPFHLAQAALAPMISQGFGRIVNIGSVTAAMGGSVEAGYGAAKAGLAGLTRSLARAMATRGVTVNLVVPGVFETDMTRAMRPEAQAAIAAMIPMGRRGDPAELAHAVRFLVDDRAGYVTGSVVTVDGGLSMGA